MLHEFLYHSIPLAFVILETILPILHQVDLIREAQNAGQLLKKVDTETLEAIIADQCLVRLLQHDVWILLYKYNMSNKKHIFHSVHTHTHQMKVIS